MILNSVIFHTNRLSEIRAFYEGLIGFPTGTYEKDNVKVPDHSDNYVNYHISGALLCFEAHPNKVDTGTIVLNVADFTKRREYLASLNIPILGGNDHYFKIKDPDGRSLIFEPLES